MKGKYLAYRALLWIIGGYHILVGALFNGPQALLIKAGKTIGGVTVMPDAGVFYLAKPFGIYLIAFGVAMWMAAWNPVKNRSLISLAVILFGLRIAQRLMTFGQTVALFGISAGRNWTMIAIVAAFCAVLVCFRVALLEEMREDAGSASDA